MAKKFSHAGFVVLSISYNAADCEHDIGNAVQWLRTVGVSIGVDPNSVGLYGWSQGGRCVYKAGLKKLKFPEQSVKAVVDMSGCGGKGPLNEISKKTKVMPPALMIAHAENDNTISIKECYDLAKHAKTKSWDVIGKEGSVIVKEVYFSTGGHNLLKNSETEPVVFDVFINHFFQYLGRPCSTSSTVGVGGFPPLIWLGHLARSRSASPSPLKKKPYCEFNKKNL